MKFSTATIKTNQPQQLSTKLKGAAGFLQPRADQPSTADLGPVWTERRYSGSIMGHIREAAWVQIQAGKCTAAPTGLSNVQR